MSSISYMEGTVWVDCNIRALRVSLCVHVVKTVRVLNVHFDLHVDYMLCNALHVGILLLLEQFLVSSFTLSLFIILLKKKINSCNKNTNSCQALNSSHFKLLILTYVGGPLGFYFLGSFFLNAFYYCNHSSEYRFEIWKLILLPDCYSNLYQFCGWKMSAHITIYLLHMKWMKKAITETIRSDT